MRRFSNITTTQLARICGVSQGTVDRALHGRPGISEQTRERILSVAREYEYTPSLRGNVPKGRSMLIGVVLFDLYNEFFSKLAMSLVEVAKQNDYSVIFLFSNKDIKQEKSAIDYFNYIGVDGIVLFSVGEGGEGYAQYLKSVMRPIVTLGNRLPGLAHLGVDDRAALYALTRQMLGSTNGPLTYFAPALRHQLGDGNAQLLRLEALRQPCARAVGRSSLPRQRRICHSRQTASSARPTTICSGCSATLVWRAPSGWPGLITSLFCALCARIF